MNPADIEGKSPFDILTDGWDDGLRAMMREELATLPPSFQKRALDIARKAHRLGRTGVK